MALISVVSAISRRRFQRSGSLRHPEIRVNGADHLHVERGGYLPALVDGHRLLRKPRRRDDEPRSLRCRRSSGRRHRHRSRFRRCRLRRRLAPRQSAARLHRSPLRPRTLTASSRRSPCAARPPPRQRHDRSKQSGPPPLRGRRQRRTGPPHPSSSAIRRRRARRGRRWPPRSPRHSSTSESVPRRVVGRSATCHSAGPPRANVVVTASYPGRLDLHRRRFRHRVARLPRRRPPSSGIPSSRTISAPEICSTGRSDRRPEPRLPRGPRIAAAPPSDRASASGTAKTAILNGQVSALHCPALQVEGWRRCGARSEERQRPKRTVDCFNCMQMPWRW